jgi:hypothetical protein
VSQQKLFAGVDQVNAAVLCPSGFVMSGGFGFFFAKAHGFGLLVAHAINLEGAHNGFGTLLTQSQVVFATTTLVGIAFHANGQARFASQVFALALDQRCEFALDIELIEVKVHAALCGNQTVGVEVIGHNGRHGRNGLGRHVNSLWGIGFGWGGAATSQKSGSGQSGESECLLGHKKFVVKKVEENGVLILVEPSALKMT